RRASSGDILKAERGVASCGGGSGTVAPGGRGPPPGTTTRTRGVRYRSGANAGERSAAPEPKIVRCERRGARVPEWDARRLARRLPAAESRPRVSEHPYVSRRSATLRWG